MITLQYADSEGELQFELTGVDADTLMVLLHIPLERRSVHAGIIVTIVPRDLTDAQNAERFERGRGDSFSAADLFDAIDLPQP